MNVKTGAEFFSQKEKSPTPEIGDIVYIQWLDAGWLKHEGLPLSDEKIASLKFPGKNIGKLIAKTDDYWILRPEIISCNDPDIDKEVNVRYDYIPIGWVTDIQWWKDGTGYHE